MFCFGGSNKVCFTTYHYPCILWLIAGVRDTSSGVCVWVVWYPKMRRSSTKYPHDDMLNVLLDWWADNLECRCFMV